MESGRSTSYAAARPQAFWRPSGASMRQAIADLAAKYGIKRVPGAPAHRAPSLLPHPALIPIRPAPFLCERDGGGHSDLVARGGAKLQCFQSPPEQGDVVDGLRALVAAVGDVSGEDVGDAATAD